ncbi:MAG: zinc-ribbon domain-containing protein [Candidatus Lokiarchaeota archaeon]|nr:zinc-ribbon domain-containing protein [Candidatus Lokiarchaeota archaeon]
MIVINRNLAARFRMRKIARKKFCFISILFVLYFLINSMSISNCSTSIELDKYPNTTSLSSEYVFDWYKDWGSSYEDYGFGAVIGSDNFLYVCGYTNVNNSGNTDMTLIKYNTSGVEQWVRTWGGPDNDVANCLTIDILNNIYIAGYTINAGDPYGDLCVVKFDNLGNYQSNITWGGNDLDEARGIVGDSTGNLYVAGKTKSFGDTDGDSVLIKFNSSLNQIWNNTWGGSLAEETEDVEIDSEGYIYVAGHSDSMDPSSGEYDNYILKYDSSGILQWAEDWDADWTQRGRALAIDSNNNIYLTGYTFGHPASSMKGLLLKYDKNGNYQWYRTFGSSGVYGNSWWSMTILPNDELFIGGYTSTHGVSTNGDCILLNYDTSGNLNWYKSWGDTGVEAIRSLTYDSELNIYAVGGSTSVGAGVEDILTLKYDYTPQSPIDNINIINPENKTYYEPMVGYYVGTTGFEDTEDGLLPFNMDDLPSDSNCHAFVVSEKSGHNKVVHIDDESSSGRVRLNYNFTDLDYGFTEFWLYAEDASDGIAIQWWDDDTYLPLIHISLDFYKWKYYNGVDLIPIPTFDSVYDPQDNTWYHLTIHFRGLGAPAYQGLNENQFKLIIDGFDSGPINFRNVGNSIERIRIFTSSASTSGFWIDAIGESQDLDYVLGDNQKEGILISYTSTTTLNWVGYSLDGGYNVSISGNQVIPIPENGVHSLILSGISSMGQSITSDLMYFAINIQEPPIPPLIPIKPFLIPYILISIGIGIVALLAIILIVFRKKIFIRHEPRINLRDRFPIDDKSTIKEEKSNFCPNCGIPVQPTYKFCVYCGQDLENT